MALPAPFIIREIWYQDRGSTFPTAFIDADDGSWSGSGVKLRTFDRQFGDLKHASVPDPAVQSSFHGRPANIVTLRGGIQQMAVKFKMHLGGGSGSTSPGVVPTLLGLVMGGIKSPTAITDAVEATSTATDIVATGHGQVAGQACLYGTRADEGGDGRVGVIKAVTDADNYDLRMALPAAPSATDAIKNGHTVYIDPDDESYQDFLILGYYAGSGAADDPDILNLSGCSGTATFGGFAPGETPFVEFSFLVGDWRNEPYSSTRTLAPQTAMSGEDPAVDRALGAFTLGDRAATTRVALSGGNYEINPNMVLAPIEDRNGVNGISGWVKMPRPNGPTIKAVRYWGDMPGLYNDYAATTGMTTKQVMFQAGHLTQATFAFDMQRAFMDDTPNRVEFNESAALELSLHGDSGETTNLATDDKKLEDAPDRYHFL